jgi:hypothetical protein
MIGSRAFLALLILLLPLPAPAMDVSAVDPAIGRWQAADGPDTASRLELTPDGRFRYALSEGALDEGAEGRWLREGTLVRLFTEPPPRPPRFIVESMGPAEGGPLSLFIRAPSGQGIAGVRFRIEFDGGPPVESYTQYDGWTGDPGEIRAPRWVQLFEPIHDIVSDRMPVPAGARLLRFRLEPNDIGVANFRGAEVRVVGNGLTLRDSRGERHFARAGE